MENTQPSSNDKNRRNKKYKKKNKRKNSKNKKSLTEGKDLLPRQNNVTPKSTLPPVDIKRVKEPLVECAFCKKTIKNIANAINGDDVYYHFDCVLKKIKEDYKVKENQKVSYIGRGSFAIIENDEEGKIKFIETIQFETPKQFDIMKKYVEENKI